MTDPTLVPRVVVLVSGGGSNLQAFIDAVAAGTLSADICGVLSNVPTAYGLERASNAGIEAACIDHRDYASREDFDAAVAHWIDGYAPDLILLAGFMRILSAGFVNRYEGRILNIHPSLLPLYPGLDTHRRAIEAGDREHGVTVHFVTAELDGGPPILQGRVPVLANDDAKTLAARVLAVEHRIYPEAARRVLTGEIVWRDGAAWSGHRRLEAPLAFV